MSLVLSTKEHQIKRIADEDIICYKYVNYIHKKKRFVTPYQHRRIEIEKSYSADFRLVQHYNYVVVTEGIHSFKNLESCIDDSKSLFFDNDGMKTHFVKCLIPKGAEYYCGNFLIYEAYASNKITYLEIIN